MSSEQNIPERKIKCPRCGLLTVYSVENKFRPFCSERCRLIDLGAWASESYKIESNTPPSEFDIENELENLSPNVAEHEKN